MGDRVSIQFEDAEGRRSAVLNDHWAGMELVSNAQAWLREFSSEYDGTRMSTPESRREPDTLMVAFVRANLGGDRLVCSTDEVDNSDNGHFVLNTKNGEIVSRR